MSRHLHPLPTIIILTLLAVGAISYAPDVTYTTVSKVSLGAGDGGALNFIARLGGGSSDVTETVKLQGNKMLQEGENESTLIDLDAGHMVMMDHERETYTIFSFDDMERQMEEMAERMSEGAEDAEARDGSEQPVETTDSDTDLSFDLSLDRTGTTSAINGNPAEQYHMILTIDAATTAGDEGEEETLEGTMVLASDLWMSTALEGYDEIQNFYGRFAEKMGGSMADVAETENIASALQQAFAGDPRIEEGLEQAQAEIAEMQGIEVKNKTYFVLVAAGETFDPDLIFGQEEAVEEEEEEEPKGGLFARARRMAERAAGGDQSDERAKETESSTQQVLMTMTTEMQDYKVTTLPASDFEIPSSYERVELGSY